MATRGGKHLHKLCHRAMQVLFPLSRCVCCGRMLVGEEALCAECAAALARYPRCPQCDRFLAVADVCPDCLAAAPEFAQVIALPYEGMVRENILALKYRQDRSLIDGAARVVLQRLQELDKDFDVIVAVPLHQKRKRERGYDQVVLLARALADYSGKDCAEKAIVRVVDTKPQHSLNPNERRENVRLAFVPGAEAEVLRGRRVLLLDDIITTGSTMAAVAGVLQQLGCTDIICAAVSSAVLK